MPDNFYSISRSLLREMLLTSGIALSKISDSTEPDSIAKDASDEAYLALDFVSQLVFGVPLDLLINDAQKGQ